MGSADRRDESGLVERLKAGDEAAFRSLVVRLGPALRSVAMGVVGNAATADEVVQETWLAVIENVGAFERRASLKTWVFSILVNKARTRARRDGRMVPLEVEGGEPIPLVPPDRFDAAGMWKTPPGGWDDITPERVVGGRQMLAHVRQAVEALPPAQKAALTMVEDAGFDHMHAARTLGIEVGHFRVLLHRARARVRRAIADLADE